MKRLLIIGFSLFSLTCLSQVDQNFNTWLGVGLEKKVVKNLNTGLSFDARIDESGVRTFFPELSAEYKVKKWIRASVEYRLLTKRNKYENYKTSSSLRTNLILKKSTKRWDFGLRLRYQYSFGRLNQSYDADFDQAIRLKPSIKYDIKGSKLTPEYSTEFYYDPMFGPEGPGFTKIRYAIGAGWSSKSPHSFKLKYLIDHRLNEAPTRLTHIISLGYSYKL